MAVFYAVLYYPDWMWMYFLEDSRNSALELIYLFAFLYYLPYVLGFYLGRDAQAHSGKLWLLLALVLLAAEAWLIAHLFDRYAAVGTRAEYLAGTAPSLFAPGNPLSLVMNLAVGCMVLYLGFVFYTYRRTRKSLRM